MIDCGRVENFVKYRREMCDKHSTTCFGCPFYSEGEANGNCVTMIYHDPKKPLRLYKSGSMKTSMMTRATLSTSPITTRQAVSNVSMLSKHRKIWKRYVTILTI